MIQKLITEKMLNRYSLVSIETLSGTVTTIKSSGFFTRKRARKALNEKVDELTVCKKGENKYYTSLTSIDRDNVEITVTRKRYIFKIQKL